MYSNHALTVQEWLYDEGEDATKNAYIAKMEELNSMGGPIRQRLLDTQEKARQEQIRIQQEKEAEEKRIRDEAEAAKKAQEEASKPAAPAQEEMQVDEQKDGAATVVNPDKDEEMTDAGGSIE
jgi:heat shock 70kDa protein 4